MDKNKLFEELLSTIQAKEPALSNKELDEITGNVVKSIENRIQIKGRGQVIIKLLTIATSAAAIALLILLFTDLYRTENYRPKVERNPYLSGIIHRNDSQQINRLETVLDYYVAKRYHQPGMSAFANQLIIKRNK